MSGRKDPWLPGPAVILHADEAHALLPVLEHGLRERHRMGAVHRLKAVADLLAPWRHLAELHDQRLRGSAGGTPVSSGVAGFVTIVPDGPQISTGVAADRLACTDRWVRRLVSAARSIGHRGAGGYWNIDAASVEAFRRRRSAA